MRLALRGPYEERREMKRFIGIGIGLVLVISALACGPAAPPPGIESPATTLTPAARFVDPTKGSHQAPTPEPTPQVLVVEIIAPDRWRNTRGESSQSHCMVLQRNREVWGGNMTLLDGSGALVATSEAISRIHDGTCHISVEFEVPDPKSWSYRICGVNCLFWDSGPIDVRQLEAYEWGVQIRFPVRRSGETLPCITC